MLHPLYAGPTYADLRQGDTLVTYLLGALQRLEEAS